MKKQILVFLCFMSFQLSAQRILPQQWFTENNFSEVDFSDGGQNKLYGLNDMKSNVKGDYFWNESFQKGKVYFYPQQLGIPNGKTVNLDSLIGIEMRVDLWNNNVEFKYGDEIKVIETAKVSNILSLNDDSSVSQYINPKEFESDHVKGLFELLGSKDGVAFLQSKEISVQRGDYNAALDVGSKEPIITKSNNFHFWNGEALIPIDSKKEVTNMLNVLALDGKGYLKSSKNKLKETEDYKKLAHFVFETSY
ncbi:hypothetical protein [Arcticibacterium luteifluviistationis]|uniref:Uncharacterized protein n=1 Tax=Arcticibacterium luteifluviistationis TaxID=1784714 RepID=A0A2Z4GEV0_9BACT|nr:hypothetical protein [Arcticibacterium luteifluviistationis]AWV99671.1 hypothetical protein DJ013_16425 [Arcticibacterium luteifluviistationis]